MALKRDYVRKSGVFNYEFEQFLSSHPQYKVDRATKTEAQILDMIQRGDLCGFILADFHCNAELAKQFEHFPVIFKRAYVSKQDVGPLMASYLTEQGLLKEPKLELISAHSGKSLLISSPLCKWYLDIGVTVTNVECFFEFTPTNALSPFVDLVCEKRYAGSRSDATFEEKMLGSTVKSLCCSFFGRTMFNPAKMVNVRYVNDKGLMKALYRDRIISMDYLGEVDTTQNYLYEMRARPKVINYCSPIHLSAFILCQAKLRILQMAYDVLYTHFLANSYDYFCSHTDSLALQCSEQNLEDFIRNCIIPGKEESFERIRNQYFVDPKDPKSKFHDGLFKLEWIGKIGISTSAKVYCIWGLEEKIVKLACRSCPSRALKDRVTLEDFRKVIYENKPISVKYRNFNYILGDMLYEEVTKTVINCYYIKRRVNANLTTSTLNV